MNEPTDFELTNDLGYLAFIQERQKEFQADCDSMTDEEIYQQFGV